ncbi:hypothetical protein HDU86_003021 [Geranomyces michiganensis]|nr:hypothetical protein HDU86_003021 [Geranomyces michiganensis]
MVLPPSFTDNYKLPTNIDKWSDFAVIVLYSGHRAYLRQLILKEKDDPNIESPGVPSDGKSNDEPNIMPTPITT